METRASRLGSDTHAQEPREEAAPVLSLGSSLQDVEQGTAHGRGEGAKKAEGHIKDSRKFHLKQK